MPSAVDKGTLFIFDSYSLVRGDGQVNSTWQLGVINAVVMPKCQQG